MPVLTEADIDAALRFDGKPYVLSGSPKDYDIKLVMCDNKALRKGMPDFPKALRNYLYFKRPLIIGSSLGGWAPPVPRRILEHVRKAQNGRMYIRFFVTNNMLNSIHISISTRFNYITSLILFC